MPDIIESYRRDNDHEFKLSMPGTTTTTTFEDDETVYQSWKSSELNDFAGWFRRTWTSEYVVAHLTQFVVYKSLETVPYRVFLTRSAGRASTALFQDPATASPLEDVSTTSEIVETNIDVTAARHRFRLLLLSELEAEPVEDGIPHNAEQVIDHAVARLPDLIPQWIEELVAEMLSEGKLTHAAGLLQCLGRTRSAALRKISGNLVALGLAQQSIEVREAAVTVVEQWGGEDILQLLQTHREPVPWLRSYIEKVRQDLAEHHE